MLQYPPNFRPDEAYRKATYKGQRREYRASRDSRLLCVCSHQLFLCNPAETEKLTARPEMQRVVFAASVAESLQTKLISYVVSAAFSQKDCWCLANAPSPQYAPNSFIKLARAVLPSSETQLQNVIKPDAQPTILPSRFGLSMHPSEVKKRESQAQYSMVYLESDFVWQLTVSMRRSCAIGIVSFAHEASLHRTALEMRLPKCVSARSFDCEVRASSSHLTCVTLEHCQCMHSAAVMPTSSTITRCANRTPFVRSRAAQHVPPARLSWAPFSSGLDVPAPTTGADSTIQRSESTISPRVCTFPRHLTYICRSEQVAHAAHSSQRHSSALQKGC